MEVDKRAILQPILDAIEPGWEIIKPLPEDRADIEILSIFQKSGGIPRLINIFCDNALLNGYAEDRKRIDKKTIDEIDCDLNIFPSNSKPNHSNSTKTSTLKKEKSHKIRYTLLFLCIFLACVFGYFYRNELFGIFENFEKKISIEKKISSIIHYLTKIQLGKDQIKLESRSISDNPINPKITPTKLLAVGGSMFAVRTLPAIGGTLTTMVLSS